MSSKSIILTGERQKSHAIETVKSLPVCDERPKFVVLVENYESYRSSRQSKLYWRFMSHLEQYADLGGKKRSKDEFHAYHAYKYLDPVIVPHPKTGMDIPVPRSTRTLGKKAFSDYMSQIQAEWAEKGVILPTLEDECYG